MTVTELIQALQDLPPDLPVVRAGYEGGLDDVSTVKQIQIRLDANDPEQWWYGPHEEDDDGDVAAVFVG
jgi:hypothetical protein